MFSKTSTSLSCQCHTAAAGQEMQRNLADDGAHKAAHEDGGRVGLLGVQKKRNQLDFRRYTAHVSYLSHVLQAGRCAIGPLQQLV